MRLQSHRRTYWTFASVLRMPTVTGELAGRWTWSEQVRGRVHLPSFWHPTLHIAIRSNDARGRSLWSTHSTCHLALERWGSSVCNSLPLIWTHFARPAAGKHKLIALTNNFSKVDIPPKEWEFLGWGDGATPNHLRELFDDFCDSSDLGMRFVELTISRLWRKSLIKIKIRKPERGFYLLACERNGIKPSEAIFLDDIGM